MKTFICNALILTGLLLCLMAPANGQSVKFTPDMVSNSATIDGYVPLAKLAGVELPRGEVAFEGNLVDVTIIPDWQFDRKSVLSGVLVRAQTILTGTPAAAINGLIYLNQGPWQIYLSRGARSETVTAGGVHYSGVIREVRADALVIDDSEKGAQVVPFTAITDMSSPKAFMFAMPVVASTTVASGLAYSGTATRLAMTPTASISRGALKNDVALRTDGDWSVRKMVLIGTVLTAAQVAQFLPELIVPLHERSLQGTANNLIFQANHPELAPLFVAPR